MIPISKVENYLLQIREIASDTLLTDCHVHPFDVMGEDVKYTRQDGDGGIYRSGTSEYRGSAVGAIPVSRAPESDITNDLKRKMALFTSRRIYSHVGPGVFSDHMSLAGIGRMVLLPVHGPEEPRLGQMDLLEEMYGSDDRFSLGICVPVSVDDEDIGDFIGDMVSRDNIRVLKIHPNITGIDTTSPGGIRRIEHMLQASRDHALKVVIHGGLSPDYLAPDFFSMGSMNNLKQLDWGITDQTIIIAHAGCYGHSRSEAENSVLPVLKAVMEKNDNLVVDTSGVEVETLDLILSKVDVERILFGSDSLYFPTWKSIVVLMDLLTRKHPSPEQALVRVAGENPDKYLFSNRSPASKTVEDVTA